MTDSEIEEMFSAVGPVAIKRMFGGKGVYFKGLIIAVELHGDIMLKADAASAPAFKAAGAIQWAYEGKAGKTINMPYWSIPADAFDDPGIMAEWARRAHEAARRSATSSNNRKRIPG
jgi:DNA transformation protein